MWYSSNISGEILDQLLTTMPFGVLISKHQKVLDLNAKFLEIFGYETKEELIGKEITMFVPEQLRQDTLIRNKRREANLDTPISYELTVLKKDGTVFTSEINVSFMTLNNSPITISFVTDLTSKLNIQKTKAKTELLYKLMFENTHDAILVLDYDTTKFVESNHNGIEIFGFNTDDIYEKSILDYIPEFQPSGEVSRSLLIKNLTKALNGKLPAFTFSFIISGEIRTFETRLFSLPTEDKRLVRLSLLDVTDILTKQRLLVEGELRYRTHMEHAPEAIVVYDHEQKAFIDANHNAADLLGIPLDQIIGMPPSRLYDLNPPEPLTPEIKDRIEQVLKGDNITIEVEIVHSSGSRIPCELRMIRFPPNDRQLVRGSFVNISQRKIAEEELQNIRDQLYQAQKLESIARITGGIAHDFNNFLTVIDGNANLLTAGLKEPKNQKYLKNIKTGTKKASELTKKLLSFSKKRILKPENVLLQEALQDTFEFGKTLLPNNIQVFLQVSEDVSAIYIDKSNLEQVILNMIINAKDAMPDGGILSIKCEIIDQKESPDHIRSFVKIIIEDTGEGIPKEHLRKIFDPFFTTKPEGKGTGLGLSTAYGIINQSGGKIEVDSQIGKGSKFIITLPHIEIDKVASTKEQSIVMDQFSVDKKVLIIDDDPMISGLIEELLVSQGYKTVSYNDGESAYEFYRNNSSNIDYIICDIIMPTINGLELVKKFSLINPSLKVIFVTGYSRMEIINEIQNFGYTIIEKPFNPEQLLSELQQL